MNNAFRTDMADGYQLDEPAIVLGAPMVGDEVLKDVKVQLALSRVNRHGLIAGATGTGKTKTLQLFAGQLSDLGVPVFAVDVKGDLSGVGAPGDAANPKVVERSESIGWAFKASGHPLEVLSLSGTHGSHVRASVSSFGPLLLGKVLDLNETQTSILSLVFRYCDDQHLPLLDLADLRTTLKFLGSDDAKAILEDLGGIGPASLGVILRAIVTIEQEGADVFFGEPEFDVNELLRTGLDGRGIVTLLEVADVMDRPRLYSTFVLWMLAQLYESLPEVGDLPKPKLAFFFDEAHLLFDDASEALLEQIERTARLIRSKGVGVYFVTQAPTDVPSSVLSQLGNRVQHALRAFTPDDADALRKTARTFPVTEHYDVERTITSLGIGEALVTVLSPKGVPTPLAATRLVPPDSRMAPLAEPELAAVVAASSLQARYGTTVDRESAHEIITARLVAARQAAEAAARAAAGGAALPAGAGAGTGTTDPTSPYGGLTRTQYEAQIRRETREAERERVRQQREAERERKANERAARAVERQRQKTLETGLRTAGRVVGSRAGQSLLRGVFDTIFGGKR
ncbi:MAG TPA: helicase HerA-like domain-containing protein [Candidatus Limnocylindria bacterium]|nr:helicase HerA-like domain-containing protein [Candidatus Limnocylindria bacterium]